MEEKSKGYEESINTLDKINKLTNEEIVVVAKELLRTITLDRKQIEDRYIITRKEFADEVMKTIMNPKYNPSKKKKDEDRASLILKYIAYIKEESKLDYNRRLLQMIK